MPGEEYPNVTLRLLTAEDFPPDLVSSSKSTSSGCICEGNIVALKIRVILARDTSYATWKSGELRVSW